MPISSRPGPEDEPAAEASGAEGRADSAGAGAVPGVARRVVQD